MEEETESDSISDEKGKLEDLRQSYRSSTTLLNTYFPKSAQNNQASDESDEEDPEGLNDSAVLDIYSQILNGTEKLTLKENENGTNKSTWKRPNLKSSQSLPNNTNGKDANQNNEKREKMKEKQLSDWDHEWSMATLLKDVEWVDLDKESSTENLFWKKNPEYILQSGFSKGSQAPFKQVGTLEDPEAYRHFYSEYFFNESHDIFIGEGDEKQVIIIRYGNENEGVGSFVLVLTKTGQARFSVPYSDPNKIEWYLKKVPQLKDVCLVKINMSQNQTLMPKIKEFEAKTNIRSFKFGVLYCKSEQNVEEDIYSNQETSKEFQDFLTILGDYVQLKGFQGFRGGLDNKEDLTGDKTVYNKLLFTYYGELIKEGNVEEGDLKDGNIPIEIVFHVAPLLPYSAFEAQQLQKKRFIGNDLVVLVFRDKDPNKQSTPLDPSIFTSQFNHVFIMVEPHTYEGETVTHYKISISSKMGVKPWRPYLPPNGIIEKENLHLWLTMKLINAERAAMYAKEFATRMSRTVVAMMNQFIEGIVLPNPVLKRDSSKKTTQRRSSFSVNKN